MPRKTCVSTSFGNYGIVLDLRRVIVACCKCSRYVRGSSSSGCRSLLWWTQCIFKFLDVGQREEHLLEDHRLRQFANAYLGERGYYLAQTPVRWATAQEKGV